MSHEHTAICAGCGARIPVSEIRAHKCWLTPTR